MQNTIVQPVQIQLLNASAAGQTTNTPKNILFPAPAAGWPQPVVNALFLNPGWWMLNWQVTFTGAAATTTQFSAGVNTVSATMPTIDFGLVQLWSPATTTATINTLCGSWLVNVGLGGLNYYLCTNALFSAGTMTNSGFINAYQIQP